MIPLPTYMKKGKENTKERIQWIISNMYKGRIDKSTFDIYYDNPKSNLSDTFKHCTKAI